MVARLPTGPVPSSIQNALRFTAGAAPIPLRDPSFSKVFTAGAAPTAPRPTAPAASPAPPVPQPAPRNVPAQAPAQTPQPAAAPTVAPPTPPPFNLGALMQQPQQQGLLELIMQALQQGAARSPLPAAGGLGGVPQLMPPGLGGGALGPVMHPALQQLLAPGGGALGLGQLIRGR